MSKLPGLLLLALLLPACGQQKQEGPKTATPQPTLVTTAVAATRALEVREETVGSIEGLIAPTVGAEVAARVTRVLAHAGATVRKGQLLAELDAQDFALQEREARAEIARIEALLANQGKVVERNQRLVQKNFISQNALDDVTTQQDALGQQLEAARARLAVIRHDGGKTRVYSPLDGRVEAQIVSVGDYVKEGDPLFNLIGTSKLRAHLPFPESVAVRLRPGQTVRLSTPTAPGREVVTTVKEIKPQVDSASLAVDVIADVVDQPGWYPGASVNGAVVLGEHPQAVVVPEQSVVLRPAGEVVYLIDNGVARQRVVTSGLREQGLVEITSGLQGGETVAVDGAGYLTDQAPVNVQAAAKP